MSALVEFPPNVYNTHAFDNFDARSEFRIENALAMMWLAQLAYETGQPDTINEIAPQWGLDITKTISRRKILQPDPSIKKTFSLDTRGIIARRNDAVLIAFGGTDPVIWENLATDFTFKPTKDDDIHSGFLAAFNAVSDVVAAAIDPRPKQLFLSGHSLGAALAVLAASFALKEKRVEATAVYTFGMPRTGGPSFAAAYNNGPLGAKTYRLVHGIDIVPRVPFPQLGFSHVGSVLRCESGNKFSSAALSASGSDEPTLVTGLATGITGAIRRAFSGNILGPAGPGPVGPLFRFLPQPIRDHLQDRYLAALEPNAAFLDFDRHGA